MAKSLYRAFRIKAEETVNTPESLSDIIGEAVEVLAELDNDLNDLFEQRRNVVGWTERFLDMQWWIGEEVLLDKDNLGYEQAKNTEKGRIAPTAARELILEVADELTAARPEPEIDTVTDSDIHDRVSTRLDEKQSLPWKNPKAVIGTIMNHNENWKRIKTGVYQYVGAMERLPDDSAVAADPVDAEEVPTNTE